MTTILEANVQSLIDSGEYRKGQENAPKPYKEAKEPAFRDAALALLDDKVGLFVTSVSQDGWPTGQVEPYVTLVGENDRPVLLIFPASNSQTLANVRSNPQVSIATQHAVSFEQMREAKGLQIQAVASVVDMDASLPGQCRNDQDQAVLDSVDHSAQTVVRIDALSAVFFDASGRPQWGQIDYYQD